jgi:toluene monooxygenase electron transfer component
MAAPVFTIKLLDSPDGERQFECAPGDTILRAGLRAGLGMPYECNVGSCGSCKLELVSGELSSAWPEAPALSDRDRAKNRVLGCQSRPAGDCSIKVRLSESCVPAHRPRQFGATLAETRDVTHDIREFRFHAPDPAGFLPGQYGLMLLPGVTGPRAYSMSNTAVADGMWHFQIKRVPNGKGTAVLFDQLRVGDRIVMDAPYGLACLRTESERDIVCIAGGSGLAPVISIARGVAGNPAMAARKLHFFYGGRGPRDICGEDMLRALPGFGERFLYYPVLSMPELDLDKTWQGRIGLVHEHALEVLGERLPEHEFYFAGPPPMVQAVRRMLMQKKVPLSQIHFDQFF